MIASKFPNLKLYHVRTQPAATINYVAQKVCSYSPIVLMQHHYRKLEYSGTIQSWQLYQLDPDIAKDTRIDNTWHFMDEHGTIHSAEVLYIRLLAGI